MSFFEKPPLKLYIFKNVVSFKAKISRIRTKNPSATSIADENIKNDLFYNALDKHKKEMNFQNHYVREKSIEHKTHVCQYTV